jgi:hypothetical protein
MERSNSPTFRACHLSEVLEPNLMKLNLSKLTLTTSNSKELNLTKSTAVNKLDAMSTMGHKQSKPTA